MLTEPMLRTLWPRAKPGKVEAIVAAAKEVLAQYEITTPLRLAHLMAQVSHENGAGTIVRENMNYSAARMMQIFGVGVHSARVTSAEAAQLAHKPKLIAERVYGLGNPKKARELGNSQPGDGYKYRGNGDLQLTGRGSHAKIGNAIGADLEARPEQLEDPAISFRTACAEFQALNCIPAADADDLNLVTRRVNGGVNGLAERRSWLARWKVAIEAEAADDGTAPEEKIDEALTANAAPRAAEVTEPVAPETGVTIAAGGTTGAGGIEATIQALQTQISPLQYSLRFLQVVMVALIFAGIGIMLWGQWKKRKNRQVEGR